MPRITRTSALAGVAGAAAVTLAGFGANAALAESTPTPSPSSSTSTEQPGSSVPGAPGDRGGRGHGPGGMRGADGAALAKALGLDEAKVEAAITKVREANRPTDKPTEGTPPSEADRQARQTAYVTALAKELGVTEAKLTAALATVRTAHEAEHRTQLSERIDEAVDAGKLTAADKASVLKAFDAGVLGGGPR
ncbi:hypothetical protein [Knoellia sp. LjRoot47]|uniref:hypothetical protein n=1 Tax=Knoellia sp. LjRoot47 TaxID=3342330 RepID=UPI003ED07BA6